jgi:hypothetical protein
MVLGDAAAMSRQAVRQRAGRPTTALSVGHRKQSMSYTASTSCSTHRRPERRAVASSASGVLIRVVLAVLVAI